MSISRKEVRRTARLARLHVGEEDLEALTRDLQAILEFVSRLGECAASAGDSGAEMVPEAPLREDTIRPGLSREEALREAPAITGGQFRVPPAIKER